MTNKRPVVAPARRPDIPLSNQTISFAGADNEHVALVTVSWSQVKAMAERAVKNKTHQSVSGPVRVRYATVGGDGKA